MSATPFTGFDRRFFAFLKALKANNTREWFTAHKAQYHAEVETPALAFVAAFAPRLKAISPRFVADARRSGGSMFRIYRDTRFSHDKTPYKTHVGLHFWHDGEGLDSPPAFYLHLEPGDLFGGGGCWHPDPVSLRKIRLRIDAAPAEWRRVLKAGIEIEGESLTRVPAGFPADHVFAADLKRKDHFMSEPFTAADAASPRFVETFAAACRRMSPLLKFLTAAQDQRW